MPFRGEHIDTATNTGKLGFSLTESRAQVLAKPLLDSMREDFCDEIRDVVWVVFNGYRALADRSV
jgi:hypothetical protein